MDELEKPMESIVGPEDVAKIAELLTVRDDKNRAALKIGFVSTMFFKEPWTRPVREAVSAAAEEYIQTFREHLRWARHPTGYMHPIDSGRVPFPWEWLPQLADGERWNFGYHGADGDEEASEFMIDALGDDNISKGVGHFRVYLPLGWFAERPGSYQQFVLNLAKRLRPVSGYGNIGLQEPLDEDGSFRVRGIVRRLAERFPGFEIESPGAQSLSIEKCGGIKGASWLTVLGDAHVEELGGLDYLRMRLGDEFPIITYDGGLMIQAGPGVQVGDAQADNWPRHLVTLAKVLKPIQWQKHYSFHVADSKRTPFMDQAATRAWLDRFDGK